MSNIKKKCDKKILKFHKLEEKKKRQEGKTLRQGEGTICNWEIPIHGMVG